MRSNSTISPWRAIHSLPCGPPPAEEKNENRKDVSVRVAPLYLQGGLTVSGGSKGASSSTLTASKVMSAAVDNKAMMALLCLFTAVRTPRAR